MRPIKLTISAFGPYADKQIIDFTQLLDRNFFLIHGPTGSGKTTILDAMCFALYGDTSGAERNGKQMCSDHSDLKELTEVTLDFTIGEDKYRVKRHPEQERPKKRGEGTITMRSEAILWQRTGLTSEEEEGTVLESTWLRVTEKIENILGFKSAQFRQVVLLPQGEFRKLLTSNSADRQVILETLFRTEFFRRIEDELKENSKELKKQHNELKAKRDYLLGEAKIENLDKLVERKNNLKTDWDKIKEKTNVFKTIEDKAQQAFLEGQQMNNKLEEKNRAEAECKKYESLEESFGNMRRELVSAQRAARFADGEDSLRRRKQEVDKASHIIGVKQEAAKEAQEFFQKKLLELEQEKDKEQQRTEAANEVVKLSEFTQKVQTLSQERARKQELEHAVNRASASRDQIKQEEKEISQSIEKDQKQISELTHEANKLPSLEGICKELQRICDKRKQLTQLFAELDVQQDLQQKLEVEYEIIEHKYQTQKAYLDKLQENWNNGQAAVLAQNLKSGLPCPVCGGLEHPTPARSAIVPPTEEQLKKEKQLFEEVESSREQLRKRVSLQLSQKAGLEQRINSIEEEISGNLEGDVSDLQNQLYESQKALKSAQRAHGELAEKQVKLLDLQNKAQGLKSQLEEAEAELLEANNIFINARAIFEEKEQNIPAHLREMSALQRAQKASDERLRTMKEQWERVQKNKEDAGVRLANAQTELTASEKNYQDLAEKFKNELTAFKQKIIEAGFKDNQNYKESKRSDEQITQLEGEIKEYDANLLGARKNLSRLIEETREMIKPDLVQLKNALDDAKSQLVQSTKEEEALRLSYELDMQRIVILEELLDELSKVEKKYFVLGKLSDVASGQNQFGLTFQRFVLGALLDDVTSAATERLKLMSKGRYYLQRTLERTDGRVKAGLDLEVLDNYTGIARPVATLSGGETFLASLSLALGLADVVQAYSGGIHLDTIFIDEGFGTLDPESLDFAIKALIDLQKDGRLVGIISHVPELKERIDARLEVVPTKRGSVARFKLA